MHERKNRGLSSSIKQLQSNYWTIRHYKLFKQLHQIYWVYWRLKSAVGTRLLKTERLKISTSRFITIFDILGPTGVCSFIPVLSNAFGLYQNNCRDTLSMANAVKQRLWACVFWGTSHSVDQLTTDFPLQRTYPSFLMKRGAYFSKVRWQNIEQLPRCKCDIHWCVFACDWHAPGCTIPWWLSRQGTHRSFAPSTSLKCHSNCCFLVGGLFKLG